MRSVSCFVVSVLLLGMTACSATLSKRDGGEVLGRANDDTSYSRSVFVRLPKGWEWMVPGYDLISTNESLFLQSILIERVHVGQDRLAPCWNCNGESLLYVNWPVRALRHPKRLFVKGMSAVELASVVLENRAKDPSVHDLVVREVIQAPVGGFEGFKAVYEFREDGLFGRTTPYRTTRYGFMFEDWFYSISYTATTRYYYEKNIDDFQAVVKSLRLLED